jgi:septal ring-binding cell division protein DamX
MSREPALHAAALPPASDADLFKPAPRQSRAGWALLVLLVSMAAFGWMYKDMLLQELELLKKYLLKGTPAVAAPAEAASAAAAASAASAQALAAAELAASVAEQAAQVASQAEDIASAASAAASAAAVSVAASEPAPLADPAVKKKTDKERKAEASSDEVWVEQLPDNAYVVQLAAMDTQDDMRSFQRSNAAYAKARILRAKHKDSGKRYYILVAGPFENKSQADAFMQSSPLLSKGWLRSSKSMKNQFTKP